MCIDFVKAEEIIINYTQCRNNEMVYTKGRTCSTGDAFNLEEVTAHIFVLGSSQ